MEARNNYEISKQNAMAYFLQFPQEPIIERLALAHDGEYLYLVFLGSRYRVHRKTAEVEQSEDGFRTVKKAGFQEVLSVFDLLGHSKECPRASGVWAPVNSLKHRPRTIAVRAELADTYAEVFDKDKEAFRAACERIGGTAAPVGDVGYEFTVFRDLKLRLKFYGSDEEFPAQTVVLWDENALEYIYYETAFYIMRFLFEKIAGAMEALS